MKFKLNTKVPFWQEDRSWIPCTVTLFNALCGLSAIFYVMGLPRGSTIVPLPAVWMIFAAMFFDTFDGFVARKLRAESVHGMNLDSFCDLISFGLAPAVIMFHMAYGMRELIPFGGTVLWIAMACYFTCTMWRLAQYNTLAMSSSDTKGLFTGLPSPAGALAICSVLLVLHRLAPDERAVSIILVCYAFIVGFLMVSGFTYMHGKKMVTTGVLPVRVALLVLSILALMQFGVFAVFVLVHLYIFSGPLMEVIAQSEEEPETTPFG